MKELTKMQAEDLADLQQKLAGWYARVVDGTIDPDCGSCSSIRFKVKRVDYRDVDRGDTYDRERFIEVDVLQTNTERL